MDGLATTIIGLLASAVAALFGALMFQIRGENQRSAAREAELQKRINTLFDTLQTRNDDKLAALVEMIKPLVPVVNGSADILREIRIQIPLLIRDRPSAGD